MKQYLNNKKDYLAYLEGKQEWNNQYFDIDTTHTQGKNSKFYSKLVEFLISREAAELNNSWSYELVGLTKGNIIPSGIMIKERNLFLRSDQLGFSAPKGKINGIWKEQYPYGLYLNKKGNPKFVADVLYDTRTIGGSFLWPLVKDGNWRSKYNCNRGTGGYIEDAVDLTLYEIKRFYDLLKLGSDKDLGNIISDMNQKEFILLKDKDAPEICRFLIHFGSFDKYVDYFCYRPFVNKNYEIIDITKADVKENDEYCFCDSDQILTDESVEEYRTQKRILSIGNNNDEAIRTNIKKILNNVKWMIRKRSVEMERIINEKNNLP